MHTYPRASQTMTAIEWFEWLRLDVIELAERKRKVEEARESLGSCGKQLGSVGGGGSHDVTAQVDAVIEQERALEADMAKHDMQLERATDILYGRSGRGGLAKARSSLDADILCCHYLHDMGWADIARDIVNPDTDYPVQWCRQRAMRALRYIDLVGMETLADS